MPAKPTLIGKHRLLSESFGRRPYTVKLREERAGDPVLLDYREGGKRVRESLGYAVRTLRGKAWAWNEAALERARVSADSRNAALRLGQLRAAAAPLELTWADATSLYHDPDKGGVPRSRSAAALAKRARVYWTNRFGPDTAYNRIQRTDVSSGCERLAAAGKVASAIKYVEYLRAIHNWLTERTDLETLRSPVKGFDWKKWRAVQEAQVRRPRYSPAETIKLVAVRHEVDPRFALLIGLMDDSGVRREAIRRTMRSALDKPLDLPPAAGRAPHGWIVYPPLKRQAPVLHYLTAFERREIDTALTTYLREMEDRYRATGRDYPLIPGAELGRMNEPVVQPDQPKAYQPASESLTRLWLLEAERLAKVPHVDSRGFHGLRRGWSDTLMEGADLKTLTVAGGWSSQNTPERIYLERHRDADREKARQVMETKREADPKVVREVVRTPRKSVGRQ